MIEYTDVNDLPDEIKVIDDFCIPEYNEFLNYKFVESGQIPFALSDSTTGGYEETPDREDKAHDFQGVHLVLRPPFVFSPAIYEFAPFFNVLPLTYKCKVNVNFRYGDTNLPYDAHEDLQEVDIPGGHYRSAIYYLNDNNGATEIRNPNGEVYFIKSNANRLVSFPGTWTHCGWSATDVKFRGAVNFIYFGEPKYDLMDQQYESQLNIADQGMMSLPNPKGA
tara:strand:- start:476 stop:1141 length:666 start_codon:yes stop_codon:yes gene_type:complete